MSAQGNHSMIYESDALTLQRHDDGILELHFDLRGESVNKFNQLTAASSSQLSKPNLQWQRLP